MTLVKRFGSGTTLTDIFNFVKPRQSIGRKHKLGGDCHQRFLIAISVLIILSLPLNAHAFGWLKNRSFDQVKITLNNLINDYESKNLMKIMDYVSERYTTDKSIFEDSLRNEFSDYAFIEIRYYVDKILPDDKNNNILITVTYIKRVQDRTTGNLSVINGTSDLIFKKEDGKYLLWKIKPNFMGKNN